MELATTEVLSEAVWYLSVNFSTYTDVTCSVHSVTLKMFRVHSIPYDQMS